MKYSEIRENNFLENKKKTHTHTKMSKEPFKSFFINKVETFRSKKKNQNNRPSVTDLKFADSNDENLYRSDENSGSLHDSDLDTTSKSISSGNNNSFRSSVQTLAANHAPALTNIYDHMTTEQINEEFEKLFWYLD